jgi:hypothetical protein
VFNNPRARQAFFSKMKTLVPGTQPPAPTNFGALKPLPQAGPALTPIPAVPSLKQPNMPDQITKPIGYENRQIMKPVRLPRVAKLLNTKKTGI